MTATWIDRIKRVDEKPGQHQFSKASGREDRTCNSVVSEIEKSRTMKVPDTRDDITLEWLNGIFKEHGIKVHDFAFTGEGSNDRGFMGTLEKVDLKVSTLNKSDLSDDRVDMDNGSSFSETERLHVILKTLPKDPLRKHFAANDGFSSREVSMYTEILKAWDSWLDSRQVPAASRFQYPKCYYGAEEGEGDSYKYLLVLENLTGTKERKKVVSSSTQEEDEEEESDFHLWGPGFAEPLPSLAASAVIRQIARFHATGLAYKMENHVDCYFSRFPKLNHTVSSTFHYMWDNGFQITREVIETVVNPEQIPHGLFEQMEKLKGEEQKQLLIKWLNDPQMVGARNTICHHDIHSNNLVLSTDYSDALLFDFQSSCVMNPMKDMSFFLVLNCTFEDATTNLSQALQVYHDEFEKTMKAMNVDFKYSLDTIEKDYRWFLVFSIIHVMTGVPIWITGKDTTEDGRRRFAMNIIDAYKKGYFSLPTEQP